MSKLFQRISGKRAGGCPQTVNRASDIIGTDSIVLQIDDDSDTTHPLQHPLHLRMQYLHVRPNSIRNYTKRKERSIHRLKCYYSRVKSYKNFSISSIVNKALDNRPYIRLEIDKHFYYALLDSGANKSVIGGELVDRIQKMEGFRKCRGTVKTADGQRQGVLGIVTLEVSFQNKCLPFEFLVVPTISQCIICGYDFWESFGLSITLPWVSELTTAECDADSLQLTVDERIKLNSIVAAFPNSETEGLGCTTLVEHRIDTGAAKPIKQRYYPISPAVEKQLCEELDRMISLGVIEEASISPWSSPVVVVRKPGKIRMCLDSRRLNAVTEKDAYPIPNVDGILSRLPPVYCISKVDLKDAFWQIKLEENSKAKTAFTVPNRPLYQFSRMPFGLCNAPQTLCRLMDIVIPYQLKSNVFVYLDDLLIVSQNLQEHFGHLLEVATQLRKAGLTININKSSFALSKVKYLGYVVGNGTLQVDDDKVKAIKELPVPRNIRQLRRFLGMTGWYRRFIQDYSTITFPLTELLAKKKLFTWSEHAQTAFDMLKYRLISAPLLVHPDYSRTFILQCDAST